MKRLILLIVGFVLFQTMYSQNKQPIDWNADLDYLFKELSERHYNLFHKRSKDDFLSGINAIKEQSQNLTDFQIALKIQQLVASFGDSHTKVHYSPMLDRSQMLPIKLFFADDALYILDTTLGNKEILEHRVLSINKVPIARIVKSLCTLLSIDNLAIVKNNMPNLIPCLQILQYFGFSNTEEVELELATNAGQTKTYTLKAEKMNRNNIISVKRDSIPFSMKKKGVLFTDAYYPDERIYHILYNSCWGKEVYLRQGNKQKAEKSPSIVAFFDKVLNTIETKEIDKIIFDMRHNGGGDSSYGTQFIEKLAAFLKDNTEVKTYVVIGRQTFSSAILNSLDFKRLTNAIFVGEETAGKPKHFGDIKSFRLPNSNLLVNYSTKYFTNGVKNNPKTLPPDVPIEMSFSDLKKGIDPVYEWIKTQ